MALYKTPRVYIGKRLRFPQTIIAVETAIPAFIGFTQQALDKKGQSLRNMPTRITSLLEYEQLFGTAPNQAFSVSVTQKKMASSDAIIQTNVEYQGTPPRIPDYMLYYSMQLFFANGGGPCYIVSVGDTSTTNYSVALFTTAITLLEKYDEPSLYVFPDACSHRALNVANDRNVGDIIDAAMQSCVKLKNRFVIADVRNAITGGTDTNKNVTTGFREKVLADKDIVKYGAAYFPYLDTSIDFLTSDDDITVASHRIINIADHVAVSRGRGTRRPASRDAITRSAGAIAAGTVISNTSIINAQTEVYNAVGAFIRSNAKVTLPASAAIAGVYARVDASRGVWKAPANVALAMVKKPAITVGNDLSSDLNVDATSGKSVNVIRFFTGKGTLVWGARTLAGNDNEWRYVPVRRFSNFVEKSVKKAMLAFVLEPNNANTWAKVRAMIENFLTMQWRAGALAGATPKDAYYVSVGLNQSMSAADILDGHMIVEIGMAAVKPAEFIVFRILQEMKK